MALGRGFWTASFTVRRIAGQAFACKHYWGSEIKFRLAGPVTAWKSYRTERNTAGSLENSGSPVVRGFAFIIGKRTLVLSWLRVDSYNRFLLRGTKKKPEGKTFCGSLGQFETDPGIKTLSSCRRRMTFHRYFRGIFAESLIGSSESALAIADFLEDSCSSSCESFPCFRRFAASYC